MAIIYKRIAYHDDVMLKSVLEAAGDIIYASGVSTPARLAKGTDGQVLTLASGLPVWATPASANPNNFVMQVNLTFTLGYTVGWTRYFNALDADTNATYYRIYIPAACTIKKGYVSVYGATNNNKYKYYVSKNGDASNALIAEGDFNNGKAINISNTSMSATYAAGDYINIKVECTEANTVNPISNCRHSITLYFEAT